MGLRTKQVERKLHYKAVGRNAHRFSLLNDKNLYRLNQRMDSLVVGSSLLRNLLAEMPTIEVKNSEK